MPPTDHLFWSQDLSSLLQHCERSVREEANALDRQQILGRSETDLIDFLIEKYSLTPPTLRRSEAYIRSDGEAQIDVSRRFDYGRFGDGGPRTVPGQRIEIAVPFDGDRSLMHVKASQYSMNPPRADVIGNELIIVFTGTQLDSEVVKRQLDATLNSIEECLSWVRTDIDRWHQQLERLSAESIRDRKQRLLVQMNTVAAIGIPIRRREGTGPSYSVPLERRARPKVLPSPSTTPFKPEPVLAIEEYAFIIDVIQRLSVQIERSPTTFIGMSEPQIRDFILVHLNGHFDGGASGETFNASGKTDILIRANGGNVFVAECKFWEGPKGLVQAVDQLLSYLTWRDTKASLIVFSKNTDFTNVIAEARKAIETHPSFKKVVAHQGETRSQFLFRLPQDANREVHMTLQLFNIPRQTPVSGEA